MVRGLVFCTSDKIEVYILEHECWCWWCSGSNCAYAAMLYAQMLVCSRPDWESLVYRLSRIHMSSVQAVLIVRLQLVVGIGNYVELVSVCLELTMLRLLALIDDFRQLYTYATPIHSAYFMLHRCCSALRS